MVVVAFLAAFVYGNTMTIHHPDLNLMTRAALEGGAMARTFLTEGFVREANKTSGDPFITNADRAIDTRLKEILTAARPDYGWLSEETAADLTQLQKDYVFVVDPIDGTRAFVDIGGQFAVSVGLLHQGQPVLGVVYRPVENQLISGGPAVGGVWFNGTPVPPRTSFTKPRVLVGYREEDRGLFARYENNFVPQVEGSIAYRYAMVGAGLAELAVTYHSLNLWDVCAGHAIALAGGADAQVLATGEAYNYRGPNLALPCGTFCALTPHLDVWRQVFRKSEK